MTTKNETATGPLSYARVFTRLKETTDVDFASIRKFSESFPEGELVDFGAGFGRLLKAGINRPMVMVENDTEMLADLKKNVGLNDHVRILEEDAFTTSLADGSVGACVYAYASLSEMRPIAFALAEAFRVLKAGGGFFAVMLNPDFPVTDSRGLTHPADKGGDFSASLLSIPTKNIGPFEYITEIKARGESWERNTLIRQVYPSIQRLSQLLKSVGFTDIKVVNGINGKPFEKTRSAVYEITAKKPEPLPRDAIQPALMKFYDSIATKYDSVMADGKYHGIKWMQEQLSGWAGAYPRVLDLGCGNGVAYRALKEIGVSPRMFGVDFSEGMIASARATKAFNGLLCCDLAADFPIVESVEFDFIAMLGVSEFLPNLETLLPKIRDALIVGGKALMTFELTRDGIKPSGSPVTESGMRKFHYSVAEIERLADFAGLKVISLTTGFAYHSPTLTVDVPYIYAHFVRPSL